MYPLERLMATMRPIFALPLLFSLLAPFGCTNAAKISETKAQEDVRSLAALVVKDVGEIERGLPEGAKQFASLLPKEESAKAEPEQVKKNLLYLQRHVPDLLVAKSTFFALTDAAGIAIRNNLDQDAIAGENLLTTFPALEKARAGEPFLITIGGFPRQPPAPKDRDWIAASPVKGASGNVRGLFVTGFPYRRFAYHLQESLRHDLELARIEKKDDSKMPLIYIAVFDETGVYGAPKTPEVSEKALEELKLHEKTQGAPAHGTLDITGRSYGYAAERTPKLGPDVGIVVLRSEV